MTISVRLQAAIEYLKAHKTPMSLELAETRVT